MALMAQHPHRRHAFLPEGSRRDRTLGWVLAGGLLLRVTALGLTGAKESSFASLESAVAAGKVHRVELTGDGLSPGSVGYATREVRWREGVLNRYVEVTEASGDDQAREARSEGAGHPVVVGSLEDRLVAIDPTLQVLTGASRSSSFEVLGMTGPGWLGVAFLALLAGCLFALSRGRPWRATRWAWAWIVLLLPILGMAAWLLLAGPTGRFRPRDPARVWLTGGWALLLALVLRAVLVP
jgi:hypothetical protein